MFRQPRHFLLLLMLLASLVVGLQLLDAYRAPLATTASPASGSVTLSAPPLLYNPDTFYEEPSAPLPAQPPRLKQEQTSRQPPRATDSPAQIAIIIDDVGLSRVQTQPVIDLPPPLALSFLPYGQTAPSLAESAKRAGHDVMLHMPMQPLGGQNPGPHAIKLGQPADEVANNITQALSRLPHVIGINNHMGSAATADNAIMQSFMAALRRMNDESGQKLFFVDSYTNAASVAYAVAQAHGLRTARRDVFLDNVPTEAAIKQQLELLVQQAQQQGRAIAIGHPYPATVAALQAFLPTLDKRGIKLVSISQLVE